MTRAIPVPSSVPDAEAAVAAGVFGAAAGSCFQEGASGEEAIVICSQSVRARGWWRYPHHRST